MKHVAVALLLGMLSTQVMAQTDTVNLKKGTTIMKIGNMTIIKPNQPDSSKTDTLRIGVDTVKMGSLIIVGKGISEGINKLGKAFESVDLKKISEDAVQGVDIKKIAETASDLLKKKKPKKVSTNWLVYDIGFAGYNDNTNYATAAAQAFLRPAGSVPASKGDFALKTSRVSNFNLWFFMQRVSIIKSVLNLKYGLGIESNNYFFKTGITYVDDINVYTTRGSMNELSKNKLVANYLTVPVMLNINTNPTKGKRGFQFSAGVSGGYLSSARQKQKGPGGTDKTKSNFNLEQFKLSYVAELGLGPVKLYGSVASNPMHQYGLDQVPYTLGLRFSN
jgi:hypothetical protein